MSDRELVSVIEGARLAERARIVAWLREQRVFGFAADRIAAGEHVQPTEPEKPSEIDAELQRLRELERRVLAGEHVQPVPDGTEGGTP